MTKIIFAISENQELAHQIILQSGNKLGNVTFRHFPDGDSYVRILSDIDQKEVIIVASLNQPDKKIIPLLFFVETAKRLGAKKVTLVAPYLAYMRQDKEFNPGEAINSQLFGKLISLYFDALVTIDPHLHRCHNLNEIYSIPTQVLHAGNLIAYWIQKNIKKPLLIGPDGESKQWVKNIAEKINEPFLVLEKIRRGDREVKVSVPHIEKYRDRTLVLVDDIISTARTMIETIHHLKTAKIQKIICIGIHAVFAENAYQNLLDSGVERIVTCNTITHESNEINVTSIISSSIK